MKYGVLTTRTTTASRCGRARPATSTCATSRGERQGRRRARVRRRVPSRGLRPGSTTRSGTPPRASPADQLDDRRRLAYVKTQITELLTNYGPIPILVIDGWSWQMGHNAVAVPGDPRAGEVAAAELPDHRPHAPRRSVGRRHHQLRGAAGRVGAGGQHLRRQAGTEDQREGWQRLVLGARHRRPDDGPGHRRPAPAGPGTEVDELPAQLPAQPRRHAATRRSSTRLRRSRRGVDAERARPPLPAQAPQNERPYTPVSATATSGRRPTRSTARTTPTTSRMWRPTGALPQSITLDLGACDPTSAGSASCPSTEQARRRRRHVTSYRILTSTDGMSFTEATPGPGPPTAK